MYTHCLVVVVVYPIKLSERVESTASLAQSVEADRRPAQRENKEKKTFRVCVNCVSSERAIFFFSFFFFFLKKTPKIDKRFFRIVPIWICVVCDRHGATEEAADKRRQRNR